ncbi:MAG TPA: hypothetical protein VIY86_04430 [Pirellulaceae bacterium]
MLVPSHPGPDPLPDATSRMSHEYFRISGGTVYDPTHGIEGEVRDLWICDGKMADPPSDSDVRAAREIDARGLVVMAGGVDLHSHFAGPKVNTAR